MDQKINWFRTAIEKGLLKQLTRRSDWRGLLQSGSFLLIFGVTVYFSYYFFMRRLWFAMAVITYAHCVFHSFVGMEAAVHELSYGTPFATKWVNELFYRLFCFLTWNNPHHFRISHMLHHQFTVHKGLDKEQVLGPIPFTALQYLSWFVFDYLKFKMIMFPNVAHFFGNAGVDFFFWDPLLPPGDKRRIKLMRWARIMIIGHLVLLALFVYLRLWILIPVSTGWRSGGRTPPCGSRPVGELPHRTSRLRGGSLLQPASAAPGHGGRPSDSVGCPP